MKHVAYNEQPNSNGQHEWIEMRDSIAKQDICIQWTIQKKTLFMLNEFPLVYIFYDVFSVFYFFVAVLFLNSV